jgi:hypothetical protein
VYFSVKILIIWIVNSSSTGPLIVGTVVLNLKDDRDSERISTRIVVHSSSLLLQWYWTSSPHSGQNQGKVLFLEWRASEHDVGCQLIQAIVSEDSSDRTVFGKVLMFD